MELERMGEFFDKRIDGYEQHQLTCIEFAQKFYPFTASALPLRPECTILDLGCGTGLELQEYLKGNPSAKITGIDLAAGMLKALKEKYAAYNITLINGSYFEVPFGEEKFDAAVSAESLHHFTMEQKIGLYQKLHRALKKDGYFILTDYVADNEQQEKELFAELARMKEEQGIKNTKIYHFDTPLTCEHEIHALNMGGFSEVSVLYKWGHTVAIKACA